MGLVSTLAKGLGQIGQQFPVAAIGKLVPKSRFGKILALGSSAAFSAISYRQITSRAQAAGSYAAACEQMRSKRLVVVSGCDSGLGLAMAIWAGKLGYKILAGCLSGEDGAGGKFLKAQLGDSCKIVQLDVTQAESLNNFRDACSAIIATETNANPDDKIELWALVPNAAVACFGEFFWQTSGQTQQIMDVNFWGTVNLTSVFKSLLLTDKSRVLVISSDCADYPLPALAVYSASKAAVQAWATSLRRELGKYGVLVTAFQPGSFPDKSRFFARHSAHYEEMKSNLTAQESEFYNDFFDTVNKFVIKNFPTPDSEEQASKNSIIAPFDDITLKNHFVALLEGNIQHKPVVIYDPFFNRLFHFVLRNAPVKYTDSLVHKLLKFPEWKAPQPGVGSVQNQIEK